MSLTAIRRLIAILCIYSTLMVVSVHPAKGEVAKSFDELKKTVLERLEEFEESRDISILTEAIFACSSIELGSDSTFPAKRLGTLQLFLLIYGQIDAAIDPEFDFEAERPIRNPSVAYEGKNIVSGIAPKAVKNPEERRAYEDALRKVEEQLQRYSLQRTLRKKVASLDAHFSVFVSNWYKASSVDRRELIESIVAADISPERVSRLMQSLGLSAHG